jgi:hypothetical protein
MAISECASPSTLPRTTTTTAMSFLMLPSELLIQVLDHFQTPHLLTLTTVCSRVHDIVCRIVRNRLLAAALVPGHILFFDCFHPTLRFTQPSLHCQHLATPGNDRLAGSQYDEVTDTAMVHTFGGDPVLGPDAGALLNQLRTLRSCYKPFRVQRAPRQPRRPGDIPGSRTFDPTASIASVTTHPDAPLATSASDGGPSNADADPVPEVTLPIRVSHQTLYLDPGELFTQLVLQVNVVSSVPGLFRSFVQICDGVVRVWRDWLVYAAAATEQLDAADHLDVPETEADRDARTLWAAPDRNVGLLVQVRRASGAVRGWPILPCASGLEDDEALSYDLEFEGEGSSC